MVEHRALPRSCRVTLGTVQREPGRGVVRIAGLLIIRQVAALTIRRQRSNRTLMTLCTVEAAVTAGEWEAVGMDKGRTFPRRRRVALRAVLREARGFMIRVNDLLIVIQMAVHAIRLQRPDTAFVTHGTSDRRVTTRKREARRMLECCAIPSRRSVTLRAICRETGRRVVRIGGRLVVVQMARDAVGR